MAKRSPNRFSFGRSRRATRAERIDCFAGIALGALGFLVFCAPFAWCILAPASFRMFLYGF